MKARELLEVISEAQQSEGFNRIASVEELVADPNRLRDAVEDDLIKMWKQK